MSKVADIDTNAFADCFPGYARLFQHSDELIEFQIGACCEIRRRAVQAFVVNRKACGSQCLELEPVGEVLILIAILQWAIYVGAIIRRLLTTARVCANTWH